MIVRFVDIGGIVDHHCVHFLFIKTKTIINEYKHRNTKDEPHGKRQHPGSAPSVAPAVLVVVMFNVRQMLQRRRTGQKEIKSIYRTYVATR